MQTRPFSSETSYLLHQKKTNYGTMCRHKTKQVKRPPQKEEQPIEKRSFLEKTKRWLAHPLSSPKGHSPLHLHIAIEEGNIEIVKALIQAHPKMIKEKNKYGQKPLDIAVMRGHFEICLLLAKKDNAILTQKNSWGQTPFLMTVQNGNLKLSQLFHELAPQILSQKDENEQTALHLASQFGKVDIADWLICTDARLLNQKDKKGWTPLDYAQNQLNDEEKKAAYKKGITPMALCYQEERKKIAILLIQNKGKSGKEINQKNATRNKLQVSPGA